MAVFAVAGSEQLLGSPTISSSSYYPPPQNQAKSTSIKILTAGMLVVVQQKQIRLGTTRLQVRSLALLSGLGIWCCRERWCRSQTRLGSCIVVALAQAGVYSSNQTPSLGTSICHGSKPRKGKRQKNKTKKKKLQPCGHLALTCSICQKYDLDELFLQTSEFCIIVPIS